METPLLITINHLNFHLPTLVPLAEDLIGHVLQIRAGLGTTWIRCVSHGSYQAPSDYSSVVNCVQLQQSIMVEKPNSLTVTER